MPGWLPRRQPASSRAEAPARPPISARQPAPAQADYSPGRLGRLLAPACPSAGSPGRATPAAARAPAQPASSLSASSTGPGRRLPRPTSDDDCALVRGPCLSPRPSRPMPTPRQSAPARPASGLRPLRRARLPRSRFFSRVPCRLRRLLLQPGVSSEPPPPAGLRRAGFARAHGRASRLAPRPRAHACGT
ncbi:hypothetical protein ACQJBY_060372 [Aegilops geniculata]